MPATMSELITKTLTRLSMSAGIDTQTYAEDRVQAMIQHKFNSLFDELWWPQFYTPAGSFTLDGSTGVVTATLTSTIKRYVDVRHVWYESDEFPLPQLPSNFNPALVRRRSISPISGAKIFKILPATTTGTITVAYRTKPDDFDLDDEIDMDEDLLVLGTCYDFLEDDASNPTATAKFEKMFNAKLMQFEKNLQQQQPSRRSPRGSVIQDSWSDA